MAFLIQYWTNYTAGHNKLQRKSELAVSSNRILAFDYDPECMVVSGHVQASMKDKS